MYYQHALFKKKGQFGIIWLAAHCPSKLTKHDIIAFDVSLKCEEIMEYVVNGRSNKPRMSLLISSHLMYGLVVILNRKTTYLYNDLILFQTELKPILSKREQKKIKTPRKATNVQNKSMLEIEENLPEYLELDMTFQVPKEVEFDFTVPSGRIRDITLTEAEADLSGLLQPIEQEAALFEQIELPPLPSEYLATHFGYEREEQENIEMLTSTAKKGVSFEERRPPFGEIDVNQLRKGRKRLPTSTSLEMTRLAMQEAISVVTPAQAERARERELAESILRGEQPSAVERGLLEVSENVRRELFEISGITEPQIPTVIEETFIGAPEVPVPPPTSPPPPTVEVSIAPLEERIQIPKAVPRRQVKRVKIGEKKRYIFDENTAIDDREMQKRMKRPVPGQSHLAKFYDQIREKEELNLMQVSSRYLRKPQLMSRKHQMKLDIHNKYIESNYITEYNLDEPFIGIRTDKSLSEESIREISERLSVRESTISRRREAVEGLPQRHDTVSYVAGAEETTLLPEQTIPSFEIEAHIPRPEEEIPPPQPEEVCELGPVPVLPIPEEIPAERLRENEAKIFEGVESGKRYFDELVTRGKSHRKETAGLFATLLNLCAKRKVKVTQEHCYDRILIEIRNSS